MSQEQYIVRGESNLGVGKVCLQVFEGIAYAGVYKIDGVNLDSSSSFPISGKSPIIAKINDLGKIVLNVDITIDYGLNVASTSQLLQTTITDKIKEMLGLDDCVVNIYIKAINF